MINGPTDSDFLKLGFAIVAVITAAFVLGFWIG